VTDERTAPPVADLLEKYVPHSNNKEPYRSLSSCRMSEKVGGAPVQYDTLYLSIGLYDPSSGVF
jgi:hypothetical protein